MLDLLVVPDENDVRGADIVCETAVILGALSSAGALTLRPLLGEHVPARLIEFVSRLPPSHVAAQRTLPPILRGLRNVLGATADAMWGHMWGVGAEQKVVGTGLVGDDVLRPARVRKGRESQWRADAVGALSIAFEPANRAALLNLIDYYPENNQILLPLYQLLARLIALPSHREAFAPGADPYVVFHLLATLCDCWSPGRRPQPRVLEAALDLLAALVKGQPNIAAMIRGYDVSEMLEGDGVGPGEDVIGLLVQLLETGPPGVRIAVANCLTNIIKADKGYHGRDRVTLNLTNSNLLHVIIKLLRTEAVEERVKLCFVLAALVSDDERLQKAAADQGCPTQLISMLVEVEADELRGEMGHEAASRSREGALLALAALSFQYEPTRSLIADASPPVLPLVCVALSHPSYGVRAAACQLARALSRTVAILRTSLVDSGVGEEVVETLKREVARRRTESEDGPVDSEVWDMTVEEELGDRAWTVEVAATATLSNLIVDFSPLRSVSGARYYMLLVLLCADSFLQKFVASGGIELLVELTASRYEPLALNALWGLKNVTYHASESTKADVMSQMGWDALRTFLSPPTATVLRQQAFGILQNLTDVQNASDLGRWLENLGTDFLLDVLEQVIDEEEVLAEPALFILSQIALGNERHRAALTARVELLEALSKALNSRNDQIRTPALRTLRHLIESTGRSQRPRQGIVDLLQPYHLKVRLKEIAECAPSITVRQSAVSILDLLDRARG